MHGSIAKKTGVWSEKKRCFESGDLSRDAEGRDSRRVKMSTGRADLEVDEEREDPEPCLRCRRRRPDRATGEQSIIRERVREHLASSHERKLRAQHSLN